MKYCAIDLSRVPGETSRESSFGLLFYKMCSMSSPKSRVLEEKKYSKKEFLTHTTHISEMVTFKKSWIPRAVVGSCVKGK